MRIATPMTEPFRHQAIVKHVYWKKTSSKFHHVDLHYLKHCSKNEDTIKCLTNKCDQIRSFPQIWLSSEEILNGKCLIYFWSSLYNIFCVITR